MIRAREETVFTILPAHGVTAAATLSQRGQQPAISVPIDSGPFCVDQNKMFWDSGEQVWKILFVSLLFSDEPGKSAGGSSDDDARALHQLAVALCTSVRSRFIVELDAG